MKDITLKLSAQTTSISIYFDTKILNYKDASKSKKGKAIAIFVANELKYICIANIKYNISITEAPVGLLLDSSNIHIGINCLASHFTKEEFQFITENLFTPFLGNGRSIMVHHINPKIVMVLTMLYHKAFLSNVED